jgi:hypothetical protein
MVIQEFTAEVEVEARRLQLDVEPKALLRSAAHHLRGADAEALSTPARRDENFDVVAWFAREAEAGPQQCIAECWYG